MQNDFGGTGAGGTKFCMPVGRQPAAVPSQVGMPVHTSGSLVLIFPVEKWHLCYPLWIVGEKVSDLALNRPPVRKGQGEGKLPEEAE